MKFFTTALTLAACVPVAFARLRGFNVAAQKADGSCKEESDWEKSFREMKKIPGDFNHVRVYAASDCNTLQNAVPAAKRTGVKILAGVWSEPESHFKTERKALQSACEAHGTDWLSGISVGSEDLYRGDISVEALTEQVLGIKHLMSTFKGGRDVPVGHVDTWTAWVRDHAASLIHAVDFIGMDGYPYYQGTPIEDAKKAFYKSLTATRLAAKKAGRHSVPIWITETAWPSAGPKDGKAVPSVANASRYWHKTMCGLFKKHTTFAFILRDENYAAGDPRFGVLNSNWKPVYNLHC